jgi:hypothetical protein
MMQRSRPGPEPGVQFSATWDLPNTNHVDMGSGVDLPAAFTARFTVEGDHTVEMDIAIDHGAPVCNGLRVMRASGRPSLTGHELRRLPIAEWVIYACSAAGFANQGGVRTTEADFESEGERRAIEDAVRARAKRKNRRTTPAFLQDVARVYRGSTDTPPVEAVREAFGPIGHSTAARYVKLARDAGYLPPTTQGKASS